MTTPAQHTPGPWETSRDAVPPGHIQITVYAETTGERVATAFEREANARLIAAAPDLYEACRLFIKYDEENCQTGLIEWARLKDAVVNAIAKAEQSSS